MSLENNDVESLLKKLVKHQKQMNSLLSEVLVALGGSGSSGGGGGGGASDSGKKEKKPRKANAWSSWVKHAPASHAGDFAKYRETHPEMKGHAIQFAKEWKETHTSEYETFVAEHTEKHSVVDGSASEAEKAPAAVAVAVAVAAPVATPVAAAKPKVKRVIKKNTPSTAEATEEE
jgi:inhibitor of KinA sporulation pathway (predicted exonuclease)